MIKPVFKKTQADMIREWEAIAEKRDAQIESGRDLSFNHVLLPCVLDLFSKSGKGNVVDIGCGTGHLTKAIGRKTRGKVVGLDMGSKNVDLARKHCNTSSNIQIVNSELGAYIKNRRAGAFSTAIANMTLMTAPNLRQMIQLIAKLLLPKANLILTIIHPCFWPLYKGYANEKWFQYDNEIPIEAPFGISLERKSKYVTTHFHRPVETYVNELVKSNFSIAEFSEPMPDRSVMEKYPVVWKYPRFLAMRCIYQKRLVKD